MRALRSFFRTLALVALAGLAISAQQATVAPASVGVAVDRLDRLHKGMQGFVDRKEASGIVTLIAREDADTLASAVPALLAHGVTSLLIEGGAVLHAAAWSSGIVDRVRCYVTPAVLGAGGVPWAMPGAFGLAALGPTRAEPLGDDVLVEADVHRTH